MSLTLLQWNCMYSEDPKLLAAFIKAINPDIVCLQELTAGYHEGIQKSGEWIAAEIGYHHYCAYGPMVLPDGTQALVGNGILSRWPLTGNKVILQEGRTEAGRIMQDERFYLQAKAVAWLKSRIAAVEVDWIVAVNTMKALLYFWQRGCVESAELAPLFKVQGQHASKTVRKKSEQYLAALE